MKKELLPFKGFLWVFLFVSITSVFLFFKYEEKYYKRFIYITNEESIYELKIDTFLIRRGTMIFNNKYSLSTHDIQYNRKIIDKIKVPFYLSKKSNNDTVFVKVANVNYQLVLLKKNTDPASF